MLMIDNQRIPGRAVVASRPTHLFLQFGSIALLSVALLLAPDIAYGECSGDGSCIPDSCNAANSCESIDDCSAGSLCLAYEEGGVIGCAPSSCACSLGYWTCTDDCASQCVAGEPDDLDRDGVLDGSDNCQMQANPQQLDADLDGYGNRCDGDFDQDGDTDQDDEDFFLANCTVSTGPPVCDLDGDGVIGNFPDFGIFGTLIGSPPGPSGLPCAGTVPCTATPAVPAFGRAGMVGLLLTLIASAVALRRRRLTA